MKYLFVTCDGGGNLPPELNLARRLVDRGHEVRFLGHRCQRPAVTDAGFDFAAYEQAPDWDYTRPETALVRDWEVSPLKMLAQVRDRWCFGPAAEFAADVVAELDRHPVDAVAVDFFLYGAAAAAERSGLPSAGLWHSIYSRDDIPTMPVFGPGLGLTRSWPGRLRDRALHAVGGRLWNKGLPALNSAREGLGLPPLGYVDEQFDRLDRVLVMSSRAFDFAALGGAPLPSNVRYVGPQVDVTARSSEERAPAEPPLVLVSFSTICQGQESALRRAVAALGTLPVRGLVTTGPAVELAGEPPANVEVVRWVPHHEVLPEAALVVTHGGMGTTMASLAHGVPVLCMPMGRDQADVAARVIHAGAGRRLRPKAGEAKLAAAIRATLADPALSRGARRIAEAIADELAPDPAVSELEALGRRTEPQAKQPAI